jgi:uncharacterized protein YqjF (DUF2071 family)
MNVTPAMAESLAEKPAHRLSAAGKERLLSVSSEPLLLADWERALFIHFEVDAAVLQREIPFTLDLWNGKAYVSLVAFTMRDMRPRLGGRVASWLFKPIATHSFLNVRTYVKNGDERGIYFITEWLANRLSVLLGPPLYGLPYRYAKLDYRHMHEENYLSGTVESPGRGGRLVYKAGLAPDDSFAPCQSGLFGEFLLERYTAFTSCGTARRFFRVWHPPWPQVSAHVSIADDTLLKRTWSWFEKAKLVGANYSPGFRDVWMGRVHRVK